MFVCFFLNVGELTFLTSVFLTQLSGSAFATRPAAARISPVSPATWRRLTARCPRTPLSSWASPSCWPPRPSATGWPTSSAATKRRVRRTAGRRGAASSTRLRLDNDSRFFFFQGTCRRVRITKRTPSPSCWQVEASSCQTSTRNRWVLLQTPWNLNAGIKISHVCMCPPGTCINSYKIYINITFIYFKH